MDALLLIVLFVAGVGVGLVASGLLRARSGAQPVRSAEQSQRQPPAPPVSPGGPRREAKDLDDLYERTEAALGAEKRPTRGLSEIRDKRRDTGFALPQVEAIAKDAQDAQDTETSEKEEVRFTAFGPRQAAVGRWASLLVYVHTPAALERARAEVRRFKDAFGFSGDVRESRDSAPTLLARNAEITLVPECEGVQFNPQSITLRWLEDLHRAEFRFRADPSLAGDAGRIQITAYVGPIIAATVRLGVLFDAPDAAPRPAEPAQAENSATAQIYRAEQIFISYSHADSAVATACRNAYRALGYQVLIDVDELRAGQNWNAELMRMIDRATIFQLFWSARSAQSRYCRQEWEYALQKAQKAGTRGEGFIRPVYWEDPMVPPPDELGHLHFAYIQLPRLVDARQGAAH